MTKVDQFESTFRSADKPVFTYEPARFERPLVVTDLPADEAEAFSGGVRSYLSGATAVPADAEWRIVAGDAFSTIRDLLDLVERGGPDLICTYRHLQTEGWRWPYTLGDHLEVLTQVTETPVLVIPHPRRDRAGGRDPTSTETVMAMTDHLTGDDRLVNVAASMTSAGGRLFLTHVEDDAVLDRYLQVISRIDSIDTDHARETISKRLLKEPHDFISSCRETLEREIPDLSVEEIVAFGHHLREYERLVDEHRVDLLVLNTKDEDQMAMHGLAYPLAVQLRSVPLLML